MKETTITFPSACTILENELPYVLSSFNKFINFPTNSPSNFPLYDWIANLAEEESKLLLRSFVLNLTRQDWLSNNPYMRGKRISPGMVFAVGYFLRRSVILSLDSNSKTLLYFVCQTLHRVVSSVFRAYESLKLSRGRALQWRNDLKYFLSSLECCMAIVVYSVAQQPEMFDLVTGPLATVFDYFLALYNLLSFLQETEGAKILSIIHDSSISHSVPFNLQNFECLKQMVGSFNPVLNFPTVSQGSLRLVLFSFVMLEDICINEDDTPVNREVDNLHLAQRDLYFSYVELLNFGRVCWQNRSPMSRDLQGMKFLIKAISRRPEMIDSSYPPLTEKQENLRTELTNYLTQTNQKTINSYL